MDKDERRKKMEDLIAKNKNRIEVQYTSNFRECLEVLGSKVKVLEDNESQDAYDKMQEDFPFTWWGRIDWDGIQKKVKGKNAIDILDFILTSLGMKSSLVYILWGCGSDPAISIHLHDAIDNIEYINAIGHDQWIYNPIDRYVVEFFHDGEVNIAWL